MLPPDHAHAGPSLADLLGSAEAEVPSWTGLSRLAIVGAAPDGGPAPVALPAAPDRPSRSSPRLRTWIGDAGAARSAPPFAWVAAWAEADAWVAAVAALDAALVAGERPLAGVHARALAAAREGALGDLRLLREGRRQPRPLATVAPVGRPHAAAGVPLAELLRTIDLFGRFIASAPVRVAADARPAGGPAALAIAVTYADGSLATARLHDVDVGVPDGHRFELVGTTARFAAEEPLDARRDPAPGAPAPWLAPPARAVWAGDDHADAPPRARRTLRLAGAVAAAIARGRPVRVDPRP